ncbi:tetratricopeptide repeat protein [Streptomyces marincola]|uniref:tetratricopeptide repeat protein n=1 Tax=Streptomyces marincola TaxID=2878388 RepID=UPI001CF46A8C|nr:tetratricopeptide repeat protein [Streptomyces marincola]UCM91024.1 hypothetical protein LC193_25460 [Streptomyces marincola]
MTDVGRVRAVAVRLQQLDDRHGGADLADVAARYVEHIESAVRSCTFGDRTRTGLYQALGEVASSAGWLSYDAGRQRQARGWWDAALRYALLADDRNLQTRIWSSMSDQATALGHGNEGIAIARVALDATRGRREGKLSALLHTRVADGHAAQGDRGPCARSLLRAERAYDQGVQEDSAHWLSFFNAGEVSAATALCQADLGQYPAAVKAARHSLAVIRETPLRRNTFSAHVRLARCLAGAGEFEEALAVGHQALDVLPGVRSPRVEDRLRQLRTDLLDRGVRGAEDFSARYEAVRAG